jgi:hypothetical protein
MTRLLSAALLILVLLAAACTQQETRGDADQFIRAFVEMLARGDSHRYESFYLQEEDFDPSAPGAEGAVRAFTVRVRDSYLAACRGAAELLRNRPVRIIGIDFTSGRKRAALFLKDVSEHHAEVFVKLEAGDMPVTLRIEEIIKVGGSWRLTRFHTVVDTGTERLDDVEIQPSTEEQEIDEAFDESGEIDP